MQKTYVVSFGLFFRSEANNYVGGGGGGDGEEEGEDPVDRFSLLGNAGKDCFPVHYRFSPYDIQREGGAGRGGRSFIF